MNNRAIRSLDVTAGAEEIGEILEHDGCVIIRNPLTPLHTFL